MNTAIKLFSLVLLSPLMIGCGGESTPDGPDAPGIDTTGIVTDTTYEEDPPLWEHAEEECNDLDTFGFCHQGLSYIKMGDEVTWALLSVKDGVVKDTVFEEVSMGVEGADTFAWNAKIVDHPDGRVILEADFQHDRYLNRVRIQSPRYHTQAGLHVGSTLREITAVYPNLYAFPLTKYGVIEVFPSNQIYFHFDLKAIFPNGVKEEALDISTIPATAQVKTIVIM